MLEDVAVDYVKDVENFLTAMIRTAKAKIGGNC